MSETFYFLQRNVAFPCELPSTYLSLKQSYKYSDTRPQNSVPTSVERAPIEPHYMVTEKLGNRRNSVSNGVKRSTKVQARTINRSECSVDDRYVSERETAAFACKGPFSRDRKSRLLGRLRTFDRPLLFAATLRVRNPIFPRNSRSSVT